MSCVPAGSARDEIKISWPRVLALRVRVSLRSHARHVWSHPQILVLVPLLVLGSLLAGGLVGIHFASSSSVSSLRLQVCQVRHRTQWRGGPNGGAAGTGVASRCIGALPDGVGYFHDS